MYHCAHRISIVILIIISTATLVATMSLSKEIGRDDAQIKKFQTQAEQEPNLEAEKEQKMILYLQTRRVMTEIGIGLAIGSCLALGIFLMTTREKKEND